MSPLDLLIWAGVICACVVLAAFSAGLVWAVVKAIRNPVKR